MLSNLFGLPERKTVTSQQAHEVKLKILETEP
jgi:hypothetical protein